MTTDNHTGQAHKHESDIAFAAGTEVIDAGDKATSSQQAKQHTIDSGVTEYIEPRQDPNAGTKAWISQQANQLEYDDADDDDVVIGGEIDSPQIPVAGKNAWIHRQEPIYKHEDDAANSGVTAPVHTGADKAAQTHQQEQPDSDDDVDIAKYNDNHAGKNAGISQSERLPESDDEEDNDSTNGGSYADAPLGSHHCNNASCALSATPLILNSPSASERCGPALWQAWLRKFHATTTLRAITTAQGPTSLTSFAHCRAMATACASKLTPRPHHKFNQPQLTFLRNRQAHAERKFFNLAALLRLQSSFFAMKPLPTSTTVLKLLHRPDNLVTIPHDGAIPECDLNKGAIICPRKIHAPKVLPTPAILTSTCHQDNILGHPSATAKFGYATGKAHASKNPPAAGRTMTSVVKMHNPARLSIPSNQIATTSQSNTFHCPTPRHFCMSSARPPGFPWCVSPSQLHYSP